MSDARDDGDHVLPARPKGPGVTPFNAGPGLDSEAGGLQSFGIRNAPKFGHESRPGYAKLRRAARTARRSVAALQVPALLASAGAIPLLTGGHGTGGMGAASQPSVIVCAGYAACDRHGHSAHNYATHAGRSYWRMTAGNECTNYVAYVESAVFRAPTPRYLLGNAGQWPSSARAHGVVVNNVPSVGAVAEWDGGAPGMGPIGHVAVVEKVGPKDRYILISQQHMGSDSDGYDWTRINAGYPSADWQEWPDHFLHFTVAQPTAVGYYRPSTGAWRLQTTLGQASPAITFSRREPGAIPLVGDWTGGTTDGTGYYTPRTGTFHLRGKPGGGAPNTSFRFGPAGLIPLAGNWDGKGGDGIGYYDPKTGRFTLRNRLSGGHADRSFIFGPPGMVPLAGDWTGNGQTQIGYYNPKTGWFHLRTHLWAGPAQYTFKFGPGGMKPLVGDWTGGKADEIGFYNPKTGWFHLRDHLWGGPASTMFRYGPPGMVPLAGNWGVG